MAWSRSRFKREQYSDENNCEFSFLVSSTFLCPNKRIKWQNSCLNKLWIVLPIAM